MRRHVLSLVGKNCSRNSNCQADSVYVVWDACCMTFLLTQKHGNKLFSLNYSETHPSLLFLDNYIVKMDTVGIAQIVI